MTDQATNTPAAPSSAPNGAADERIHTGGGSFHEFQARVDARLKAQQQKPAPAQRQGLDQPAPSQPKPPNKTAVQPAPPKTLEQVQAEAQQQNAADLGEQSAEEAQQAEAEGQQQAPEGITPEDLELLAKAKAWLESETIPEEFLSKMVKLKNGDEVEYEPFSESLEGRMRQRDHTRQMQAIQKEREQYKEHLGFYESHFQAIFNDENNGKAGGEAMYELYSRAGKRKQLLALGEKLAQEEQQDIDGANGVGLALMRRLQLKDHRDHRVQDAIKSEFARRQKVRETDAENLALKHENQRLKQQTEVKQREAQDQEHYATQRKQLEQLRPRAFEAMGLNHEDPVHRQEFDTYLDAIIRQEQAQRVTPDLVMKAARAAKEGVKDLEKRRLAAGNPPAAPQPRGGFNPQLGGGGRVPSAATAKNQQWHSGSFAEKFLPQWKR